MSSDKDSDAPSKPPASSGAAAMKGEFDAGQKGMATKPLFTADEIDIYVNKVTLEAYVFHGKEINYEQIDFLEYFSDDYSVDVVRKDGTRQDLGVKIQWIVRPYWTKALEINIVRTKNGESIDGRVVPLRKTAKRG